ncbi:hypothetical protein, partial [Streptomyces sp. SID3343]|uniref:hypothetical protein n=1 Tax=Streptomyces sp. SID3343 TaxID=2690260 RepID=UPI001F1B8C87
SFAFRLEAFAFSASGSSSLAGLSTRSAHRFGFGNLFFPLLSATPRTLADRISHRLIDRQFAFRQSSRGIRAQNEACDAHAHHTWFK